MFGSKPNDESSILSRFAKYMDRKEYFKQHYLDNLEIERQKRKDYYTENHECINKQRRKQRKLKKEFIDGYKLGHGCAICGYNRCAEALDFHHEGEEEKLFRIARGLGSNSLEKIREEMAKCTVLCANCHRELHARD